MYSSPALFLRYRHRNCSTLTCALYALLSSVNWTRLHSSLDYLCCRFSWTFIVVFAHSCLYSAAHLRLRWRFPSLLAHGDTERLDFFYFLLAYFQPCTTLMTPHATPVETSNFFPSRISRCLSHILREGLSSFNFPDRAQSLKSRCLVKIVPFLNPVWIVKSFFSLPSVASIFTWSSVISIPSCKSGKHKTASSKSYSTKMRKRHCQYLSVI